MLPLTDQRKLYIRSAYRVIADQVLGNPSPSTTGRKYAAVTGTPGIGKSVLVYYLLFRLIKDHKRVLFFSRNGPAYFDRDTMFDCDSLPHTFDLRFWTPDLWCLVDSKDPTLMNELPIHYCSILLVTTLCNGRLSHFNKLAPTPDVFFMPPRGTNRGDASVAGASTIKGCVEAGHLADQIHAPKTSTALDVWMPGVGGFHVVVETQHDMKDGVADDLAKLGPNGNRLFYLLSLHDFESFTTKAIPSIEQFALLIPFPTFYVMVSTDW